MLGVAGGRRQQVAAGLERRVAMIQLRLDPGHLPKRLGTVFGVNCGQSAQRVGGLRQLSGTFEDPARPKSRLTPGSRRAGRTDRVFRATDCGGGGGPLPRCLSVASELVPGKRARLAARGQCLLKAGGPLLEHPGGLLELDAPREHLLSLLGAFG